jgi:hypothetical protein
MGVKSLRSAGVGVIAAVGLVVVAAPASAVASAGPVTIAAPPSAAADLDCAIVGSAAPGPTQPSPILGSACFATHAEADAFAAQTAKDAPAALAPDASLHLAASWSDTDGNGQRIDWYGTSGPCTYHGRYYNFLNFSGWVNNNLASDSQDLASAANCLTAHFHDPPDLTGTVWNCNGEPNNPPWYQSCFPTMGSYNNLASSVRMLY